MCLAAFPVFGRSAVSLVNGMVVLLLNSWPLIVPNGLFFQIRVVLRARRVIPSTIRLGFLY